VPGEKVLKAPAGEGIIQPPGEPEEKLSAFITSLRSHPE
jgi:hypothetical protein